MVNAIFALPPAVCLCIISMAPLSLADEPEVDKKNTQSCINVRTLKRTLVVDDQRILFVMLGRKTFLNILPRSCKGLSRERRFSYSTSGRRLCGHDMIRVLRGNAGVLDEGKLCRLGPFIPITREDVVTIVQKSQAPPQAKPPSLPEPEDIVSDNKDSEDLSPDEKKEGSRPQ